ncbi:MAG: DUF4268 domain-containing protein [Chloroflexota bacterium]|nr:DUF4268 domain-containing protein [Chloroflexota bacterium]
MTAMSIPPLGKLSRVDARTVWRHEALDFTPWIRANIDTLSEALGMELELPETEVQVGDFSCDVVAQEVGTGHLVIIENQLEATDHAHLGQLLTYAAGLNARGIVWISPQYRPEHRQAIDWLNANTGEELVFFGVEVELLRIGDSPYAPHFKVVALPNDWQKAVKARVRPQPNDRGLAYQQFFTDLIHIYKQRFPSQRTANKAGVNSWLTFASAGRSGFAFAVAFGKDALLRVELYIDVGDGVTNKEAFDALFAQRDAIEEEIGEPVTWQRLDSARASRVAVQRKGQISDDDPLLTEHLNWCATMVGRFRQTFSDRVKALQLERKTNNGSIQTEDLLTHE